MNKRFFDNGGPGEGAGSGYKMEVPEDTTKSILQNLAETASDGEVKTGDKGDNLGIVETEFDKKTKLANENMAIAMEIGYRSLGLELLPSKGQYYPTDCMLSIRAADVSEIKHFSSMNETDYVDAEEKVTYVLEKCCKLVWGGKVKSSIYLKDADKLYLLFTIRDLSMQLQGKENRIMMNPQCPHCGEKQKIELVNNIFGFYDVPAGIKKYYNEEARCFVIPVPNTDEIIKIFVPNIGVTSWVKKFIVDRETKKARNQEDSYYSTTTLQFMQFIVESPTGCTENLYNSTHKKIAEEWSLQKMEIMRYVSDKLSTAIKPTITVQCKTENGGGCKKEFSAPITFRQGLRRLFDVTGVVAELFGDTE